MKEQQKVIINTHTHTPSQKYLENKYLLQLTNYTLCWKDMFYCLNVH